jgi:hypothetical protein
MYIKSFLSLAVFAGLSISAHAKPSINDMQGCQAVIDFMDAKLADAPAKYDASNVKTARKGLKIYNSYIQNDIVSPGLLEFNGGDVAKAKAMQDQVDTYKASLTAALNSKFPQQRIFMDHVVTLNNCAKKAVPSGADLDALKASMNAMVIMAKKG